MVRKAITGLVTVGIIGAGLYLLVKSTGGTNGGYLSEIAAATTIAQLEEIRVRFEADLASGVLTYEEYMAIFDAYVARYYEI